MNDEAPHPRFNATPKLDVIIPTNRASAYLPEALASIEAQVGVDCNIVVVDDGSPDAAYIRQCAAKVARCAVIRQAPAGVSSARNRGLRESAADYVAFLDDDDAWHPTKAAKQIAALAADRRAVACACWGWYTDASGKRLGSWPPVEVRSSDEYLSGYAPLPRIVTLVFTRAVCEMVGGFDESFRQAEDLEFTLRTLLHGECAVVQERLVCYRQHDANTSRVGIIQGRDDGARMVRKLVALCDSSGNSHRSSLLRRQLEQRQGAACLESLRRLRTAIRSGSIGEASFETSWLLRHTHWLPSAVPQVVNHLRNR